MKNQKIEIDALRVLLETQLQVLALTVVITHKGSATFLEQELCSSLPDAVQGVVTPMAMAVGGSVQSILELSSGPAGSIRDCYPLARSVVETMTNASYVLAGGTEIAEKAIRHAKQKYHRDMDRIFGKGSNTMRLRAVGVSEAELSSELKDALDEFTAKNGREKSWTDDSVATRISVIGEKLGPMVATRLLGAYALVYQDASEIVHGSLYGINLFNIGRGKTPTNVEEFVEVANGHLIGILYALFFAITSYVRSNAELQGHQALVDLDSGQWERFEGLVKGQTTGDN
ncbi:DUF5677 domain-containing protein [Rhodoferax sp.]|uniref:DUF5677 domain-containing protein n=1 Tax=Rhodoferax sp. TaxID=50421 RepID=UPI00263A2D64|nr:DUF5677 domain-containing protein [Rhodoferax sp.]MDD2917685.1 DUF5677 domain-containing protein [Rhodoferax sp.]